MTAKILMEARKQQSELQDEFGIGEEEEEVNENRQTKLNLTSEEFAKTKKASAEFDANFRNFKKLQNSRVEQQKIRKSENDESESDSENEDQMEEYENKRDYYSDEDVVINEEDQRAFDVFMSNKANARRTIADIIMDKLTEKKTEIQSQMSDDSRTVGADLQLDERVVKMYTQIKAVLQKYRSGKLPKAFKIIPSLNNWEHVI